MRIKNRNTIARLLRSKLSRAINSEEVFRVFEWYESISNSYDELYFNEQINKYNLIIKESIVRALLSKGNNKLILDLGCGTANFIHYLRTLGDKYLNDVFYVGLDISLNQLSRALSKIRNECNIIAEFIAGDLLYPPLREGLNPTIILMMSVLRCNYEYEDVLKYFREVHKPAIFFYSILCSNEEMLQKLLEELSRSAKCMKYLNYEVVCSEVKNL